MICSSIAACAGSDMDPALSIPPPLAQPAGECRRLTQFACTAKEASAAKMQANSTGPQGRVPGGVKWSAFWKCAHGHTPSMVPPAGASGVPAATQGVIDDKGWRPEGGEHALPSSISGATPSGGNAVRSGDTASVAHGTARTDVAVTVANPDASDALRKQMVVDPTCTMHGHGSAPTACATQLPASDGASSAGAPAPMHATVMEVAPDDAGTGEAGSAKLPPGVIAGDLRATLDRILSHSGGVADEKHVPVLEALFAGESRPDVRTLLLLVLQQSSHGVKSRCLAGRALKYIEGWVD